MRKLEGRVALIDGADGTMGHAVALALSARGARVVVAGVVEKTLAETVGEIAHGGGKARHVAGDDPVRAIDRVFEVFGGLDFVVACAGAERTFAAASSRMKPRDMAIAIDAHGVAPEAVASLVAFACEGASAEAGRTFEIR